MSGRDFLNYETLFAFFYSKEERSGLHLSELNRGLEFHMKVLEDQMNIVQDYLLCIAKHERDVYFERLNEVAQRSGFINTVPVPLVQGHFGAGNGALISYRWFKNTTGKIGVDGEKSNQKQVNIKPPTNRDKPYTETTFQRCTSNKAEVPAIAVDTESRFLFVRRMNTKLKVMQKHFRYMKDMGESLKILTSRYHARWDK